MSIFKESFRKCVQQQLKLREHIVAMGNKDKGRFVSSVLDLTKQGGQKVNIPKPLRYFKLDDTDIFSSVLRYKITEDATGRVSYPGTVITTELPRAALVTVDRPLTSYNNDSLLDMEASSFFEMACKVTNQQLVLILKIAADSPAFDIDKLTEEIVGDLVSRNIERIEETADKMINLVGHEYYRLRLPDEYQGIIDRWRFSQTEQHHLERLIRRWNVIFEGKKLMPLIDRCRSGKSVLKELSVKLDSFEIDWCDV